MPKLKAAGLIDKQIFVIYIRNTTQQSYLELGTPNNNVDYFYAALDPNPNLWKLTVRSHNVLGTLKVQTIVLDSTSAFIYTPLQDLEAIRT